MYVRSKPNIKLSRGFTVVEVLVGIVIFGIIVSGLMSAYKSVKSSYTAARQLNEMYTVLSACPEVDRALEYTSLSSSANCYPNNTFAVENSPTGGSVTYTPNITVTPTSSLDSADPLYNVPDSKIVAIELGFLAPNQNAQPLELRLLITRNGIGQL